MVHIPATPRPAPATVPPSVTDPQIRQAAQDSLAAAAAKGYGSTILTSGQGDTSAAAIGKKQLTGG